MKFDGMDALKAQMDEDAARSAALDWAACRLDGGGASVCISAPTR